MSILDTKPVASMNGGAILASRLVSEPGCSSDFTFQLSTYLPTYLPATWYVSSWFRSYQEYSLTHTLSPTAPRAKERKKQKISACLLFFSFLTTQHIISKRERAAAGAESRTFDVHSAKPEPAVNEPVLAGFRLLAG